MEHQKKKACSKQYVLNSAPDEAIASLVLEVKVRIEYAGIEQ